MSFTSPAQYQAQYGNGRRAPKALVEISRVEEAAMGFAGSSAGPAVTDQAAMRLSAFWACTKMRAGSIGSMPVEIYRPGKSGFPEPARDLPIWRLLHDSPNADEDPTSFFETMVVGMILKGNGYARIRRRPDGEILSLESITSDVRVRRKADGRKGYRYSQDGRTHDLDEREVFHVRGFGGGPLGGLSTVAYARESLGIALAAEQTAGSHFKNGARPSGVLSYENWLEDKQYADARELIETRFAGALNAGRPFILEGGGKWSPVSMNAEDAQLLQSRGWSVEDICRWHLMPPVLIGHNEKTSSWGTGIQEIKHGFLTFCLGPDIRRFKQAIARQLLTPAQRAAGLFPKFNVEGMLAADSHKRADYYGKMTAIGAMTINEVRAKEDLPPVPGGDVPRIQKQNAPIDEAEGKVE